MEGFPSWIPFIRPRDRDDDRRARLMEELCRNTPPGPFRDKVCGPSPAPSAPPPAPESPPSIDLPPTLLEPPAPVALPPPTLADASSLASFALLAQAQSPIRRPNQSGDGGTIGRSFAQAYGYGSVRLRKARRMARNRRTMRAQTEIPEATVPRDRALVPLDRAQTPQEMQRAVESEGRDRAEELRRLRAEEEALRKRPAQTVPNAAPPDTRRRGGRLTPIFDPFSLATDVGTIIGEIAGQALGEAKYGRTPEEEAEADRIEREVRDRTRELDRRLDEPLGPIPKRMAPPATPRGIEAYDTVEAARRSRVMLPIPQMPKAAPPAPSNRGRRSLTRIQNAMRNPWAQLGVFGLGLLGGRRSKRAPSAAAIAASSTAMPDDIPEDLTTVNAGMLPFAATGGAGYGFTAQSTSCDCKPKRRGPKRRCLERADVSWRTGRYKGKRAGSKCVRWE